MSLWDTPLEIDFPELFSSTDRQGFARLASKEEGIRIYADRLEHGDGVFSCQLLISFAFSRPFFTSFQRMARAIVITFENAHTGQCRAISLLDPHKKYPPSKGSNYMPDTAPKSQGIKTAFCEIPIAMKMPKPNWGPHLFIRAQLQEYVSNILALDFRDNVELGTYLDAQPFTVSFGDAIDE